MDSPAGSRERLHRRSTCAEQGRTQSDSRCITTRPSVCQGRAVSYGPRSSQGICSLKLLAVLSSSSQLCCNALMSYRSSLAKFLVNRLSSPMGKPNQSRIHLGVHHRTLRAITGPLAPQSFPDGGVERSHQHFKHTTPLVYFFRDDPLHFAEFIRFGECNCFGTAIASIQL